MIVPPLLIAQGVLFLFWAGFAFRILFHLRRRAADRTGHMFPGPFSFIGVTREWLTDPEERRFRNGFIALTFALITVSVIFSTTR